MISSAKDGPSLQLHEYSITDASGKVMKRSSQEGLNADVYTEPRKSSKVGKPAASAPTTARGKPGHDGSCIPREYNRDDRWS